MWYSLGTTLSLAMLRVTRRSLKESLGILRFGSKRIRSVQIVPRVQNFAGARYSGWSNWKVWHDLVKAHPSGDCIFWLVCFVLCFWTLLLTMILQQHLKTGDVERVIANFAKSVSTFLLTTNFPTAKVRRQCVCDLNQTHKKTEIIPDIFALFHHIWYR